MNQLVNLENGQASVDSKVIADAFGKIHRDVLRAIDNLDCSEGFRVRNFAHSSYTSEQGKVLPCVKMTRDGFCLVAMGFTGKQAAHWKEAFIEAFNQMEEALQAKEKSLMGAFNEAIALLENDKQIAGVHAKALAHWKKVRKQHIENVTAAHEKAQLVLNFKS